MLHFYPKLVTYLIDLVVDFYFISKTSDDFFALILIEIKLVKLVSKKGVNELLLSMKQIIML